MKTTYIFFGITMFALASAACSSSAETNDGVGGSGGSGGSAPVSCTTVDGCGDNQYCDFPDDLCGAGEAGSCKDRLAVCSDGALILCGCNGKVNYAGCAEMAGFDTNVDASACADESGVSDPVFACGDRFCRVEVSYCKHQVSDVDGEPDEYSCELFPAACTAGSTLPSCDCLLEEPCGSVCKDAADGGLTLSCPGG